MPDAYPTLKSYACYSTRKRGQYMGRLFKDTQSKCLSADRFSEITFSEYCGYHKIVNFTKGNIDETATENVGWCQSVFFYIRAVRSIK